MKTFLSLPFFSEEEKKFYDYVVSNVINKDYIIDPIAYSNIQSLSFPEKITKLTETVYRKIDRSEYLIHQLNINDLGGIAEYVFAKELGIDTLVLVRKGEQVPEGLVVFTDPEFCLVDLSEELNPLYISKELEYCIKYLYDVIFNDEDLEDALNMLITNFNFKVSPATKAFIQGLKNIHDK